MQVSNDTKTEIYSFKYIWFIGSKYGTLII